MANSRSDILTQNEFSGVVVGDGVRDNRGGQQTAHSTRPRPPLSTDVAGGTSRGVPQPRRSFLPLYLPSEIVPRLGRPDRMRHEVQKSKPVTNADNTPDLESSVSESSVRTKPVASSSPATANPISLMMRWLRSRRQSQVAPAPSSRLRDSLDYYSSALTHPIHGLNLRTFLLDEYVEVMIGWGSFVKVQSEWDNVLYGDELLGLAIRVTESSKLSNEILLTTLMVLSELNLKSQAGGDMDNIGVMQKILNRETVIQKLCSDKRLLIIEAIFDRHTDQWPGRPLTVPLGKRQWHILQYTGLSWANRVCSFDMDIRKIFLAQRVQQHTWFNHIYHSGFVPLTVQTGTVWRDSLDYLTTMDPNDLRTKIRVQRGPDQISTKAWFFDQMGSGFAENGLLVRDAHQVNAPLPSEDMYFTLSSGGAVADHFAMGRFFALCIVNDKPVGYGLSPLLWELLYGTSVPEDEIAQRLIGTDFDNDEALSLCESEKDNHILCFLLGFNDILPRNLLRDGLIEPNEINDMLIGYTHIDPTGLARLLVPTGAQYAGIGMHREWLRDIIKHDLDQHELTRLVKWVSGDNRVINRDTLRQRIGEVEVVVRMQPSISDTILPTMDRQTNRLMLPAYANTHIMRTNLKTVLKNFNGMQSV